MSAATELAALKAAWARVRNEVMAYDRLVTKPTPASLSVNAKAGRPKVEIQALLYVASSGTTPNITLSTTHAPSNTSITITGSGFGALKGASTVTFGERPNSKGWASCARVATVTNWSNNSITCTVPYMSPGKAGAPNTYHPVYVTVNGVLTDSADFYMDPATTYTSQSYSSARLSSQSNVLYDRCSFRSSTTDDADSAMLLSGGGSSITFHNCTFASSGSNGSTINELNNSNIRDITFSDCTWGYCYRMNFECTARAYPYGSETIQYQRIALIGGVFNVSGTESVSFDGHEDEALPTYCLIKDCHIKGAGNSWDDPQWEWGAHGFEINGPPYFTVQNLTIGQVRAYCLNIGTGDPTNGHLVFENCTFDRGIRDPAMTRTISSATRTALVLGMNRSHWLNCVFDCGDGISYNNMHLENSSYNVFQNCTWRGDDPSVSLIGSSTGNTGLP